jgi:DNA-binding transcriptional LysR family regulator
VSALKGSDPVALTVDEATLTHAAVAQGLGVGLMPCFMGDADASLRRYRAPTPETDLDLWLLLHGDLKATAKVRAFVNFVRAAVREGLDLLEGRAPA